MARPGGNPDISNPDKNPFVFQTDREESLTKLLALRVSKSMHDRLHRFPDWQEWVREAIRIRLETEHDD